MACSPFSAVSTSRPSFLQRTDSARTTAGSSSAIKTFRLVPRCPALVPSWPSFAPAVRKGEGLGPPAGAPGWRSMRRSGPGPCRVSRRNRWRPARSALSRARSAESADRMIAGIFARVDGVLQPLKQREAVHHRHAQVEDDGVGRIVWRDIEALLPVERHDRLEPGFAAAAEPIARVISRSSSTIRTRVLPRSYSLQPAAAGSPASEPRGLRGCAHRRREWRRRRPFRAAGECPRSDRAEADVRQRSVGAVAIAPHRRRGCAR